MRKQQPTVTEPRPLLTVAALARRLAISSRTLFRRLATGDVLAPVGRLAGPRWDADETERWIAAGMPSNEQWQRQKRQAA
jgi:hypothetical protein